MSLSIDVLLKQAVEQLVAINSPSPQLDAEVLLGHVLNKPRSYLFGWPEKEIEGTIAEYFNELLSLRLLGKPIAYIIGYREFWSLRLKVSSATLIPRPDTERLVEIALHHLNETSSSVLDLGTGTGAIALALASEKPRLNIIGIDHQKEAVTLAKTNAKENHILNVEFYQGSWFEPINKLTHGIVDKKKGATFSMIVSNPPYIDERDPHLFQGDVRFEPQSALIAPNEGFADLLYIIEHSRRYLSYGGWLLLEHGYQQGEVLRNCFINCGYLNVKTEQDYASNDRVTIGQWLP